MIIGFYPGAGGNRYYHYLEGRRDFEPLTTYDHLLQNQEQTYRYLSSDTLGLLDKSLILTHCVNVPIIRKNFPQHQEVIIIVADLDLCLKREYALAEQYRDKAIEDKIEHARASIGFHHRYYDQYPLDTGGATRIVNIMEDHCDFSRMMRQELSAVQSAAFDQALDQYKRNQPMKLADLPGDKILEGFKSQFLSDAEIMQQRLDKVSPSLCLAKWKQVSLHLTTGMNNSCYHPPLHVIPIESIKNNPHALHNTDHKKQQRRMMLNGVRPAECQYCWNMEDNGKLSDRHYRSGEPWAAKDFGQIVSADWNDDFYPSYVEVNFNHACNLMCSYCSPQFSSSWMQESEKFGAFPTSTRHNDPIHFVGSNRPIPTREHNPYVEAFWKWWPDLYPQLQHFRMTGGEPLMDRNTYRVFDYVLEHHNPNLHLNVTSNFSVEQKLFDRYLDYVKIITERDRVEHFMQYVSVDTWGSQAEYLRYGLDFDLLWQRVEKFLQEVPSRSSITFIITMNNLSVPNLDRLLKGILDLRIRHSTSYQRVWFDTPVLRQPAWQSLQILPESYACRLDKLHAWMLQNIETSESRFHGFKDYECQRMDRDIAWMRAAQGQDHSVAKADFYRFFSEHDRRRGTDFLSTFPEMTQWWKECETYAQRS